MNTERDRAFLDVDSWQSVRIFNPAGKEIFDARAKSSLLNQGGGTEMFVESNEPTLDELSLEEFFEIFPEGTYRFAGRTPDGAALTGEAEFSHDIPAAPEVVLPMVSEDACAENVPIPVVIDWNEVATTIDNEPIDIKAYEVIIEHDDLNFDVISSADTGTTLTIPAELIEPGTDRRRRTAPRGAFSGAGRGSQRAAGRTAPDLDIAPPQASVW